MVSLCKPDASVHDYVKYFLLPSLFVKDILHLVLRENTATHIFPLKSLNVISAHTAGSNRYDIIRAGVFLNSRRAVHRGGTRRFSRNSVPCPYQRPAQTQIWAREHRPSSEAGTRLAVHCQGEAPPAPSPSPSLPPNCSVPIKPPHPSLRPENRLLLSLN